MVQGVTRGVGQVGVEHHVPDADVQRRPADGRGRGARVAATAQLRRRVDGRHAHHPSHGPGPAGDRDRDPAVLPDRDAAVAEALVDHGAAIVPGRVADLAGERVEPFGQQIPVPFGGEPGCPFGFRCGPGELAEPEQAHPALRRDRVPGSVRPGRRERVGRLPGAVDAGNLVPGRGEITGEFGGGRPAHMGGEQDRELRRVHEYGPDDPSHPHRTCAFRVGTGGREPPAEQRLIGAGAWCRGGRGRVGVEAAAFTRRFSVMVSTTVLRAGSACRNSPASARNSAASAVMNQPMSVMVSSCAGTKGRCGTNQRR